MKISRFIILVTFLITSLFSSALMADRLPTYQDVHQKLEIQVEQVKDQIKDRFPADSLIELIVIEDRDSYFKEKIIRVVLSEKPYGGYYWQTIFELKKVNFRNVEAKSSELFQLVSEEITLQQKLQGLENDVVSEVHSQSYVGQSFDDSKLSMGGNGKYLSVWVQLPSLDKEEKEMTDVRWMRTTVRASINVNENSSECLAVRSVIWSLRHKENYYNEGTAGLVELGAIEGTIDFDPETDVTGSLMVDLVQLDQTKRFDLNQTLSFFYTLGVGVALDFIFKEDSFDTSFYADYKVRLGISVKENILISAGADLKTNHNERGYLKTDLSITLANGNASLTTTAGFLHNGKMNSDAYQLTEGWYLGMYLTFCLK